VLRVAKNAVKLRGFHFKAVESDQLSEVQELNTEKIKALTTNPLRKK